MTRPLATVSSCACACDCGSVAVQSAPPFHAAGIVVATDALPDADGAVRVAVALSQRDNVPARILSVVEPPAPADDDGLVPAGTTSFLDIAREARDEQLRSQRDRTFPAAADWLADIAIGDRVKTIVKAGEAGRAGLIIVGLGAHGLSARLRVRETALRVIREAVVPVLAVPSDAWGVPHSAVAAIDFTPSSEHAARAALDLLGGTGTLYLAHVAPRVTNSPSESNASDLGGDASVLGALDGVVRRLAIPSGVDVEHVILHGEPAAELLAFADERRVELIAAGSHGRSAIERIFLGSVSTRLVRTAHCWMLVAPPS